jgi:hypothetical protein
MNDTIPILSLLVASLAVFVGPFVSWFIARRQVVSSLEVANKQLASSLEVANKQILAPMRQAWINNLRDLLAELASSSLHYFVAGFEGRTETEYQRLALLEHKIAMMLNATEEDHKRLEELIRKMISSLEHGREGEADFPNVHRTVMDLSRQILKSEWNRIRDKIQPV